MALLSNGGVSYLLFTIVRLWAHSWVTIKWLLLGWVTVCRLVNCLSTGI